MSIRKTLTLSVRMFAAVAGFVSLAPGCSSDDPSGPDFVDAVINELRIRPGTPIVAAGRRIQLVAEAKTEEGFVYDQNSVVEWESADEGILTVNPVGIAYGIAGGTTEVTATHPDGPTATVSVQVLSGDVTGIRLEPASPTILVGEDLPIAGAQEPRRRHDFGN